MTCVNMMSKALILTVSMVTLAACSDGQLSTPPPTLAVVEPIPVLINSFTVSDAKDPKANANKTATIDAGGSVMVSWDVNNAKKIEITDGKGRQLANVSGLVGKTQSDPLVANETFTLTAEGSDGVKAQATATVTIRKKEIKITAFKADPPEIKAGEEARLCWTISDAKANVSVKAGDEEIYPIPADQPTVTAEDKDKGSDKTAATASKAMQFLLKGGDTPSAPPADSYAAATDSPKTDAKPTDGQEVCPVTVQPTKTTTYTLSVMDGDKVADTKDAKVTVAQVPATIAAFIAQPAQLSGPGEVTLSWRVTPKDVTVSIDHGVTTNDKAEGEKKVQVSETTTYTLTATTKDGQVQTQTVTVTLPSAADLRVETKTLTPSIFAGETAKIAITHGNASGKVTVLDAFGASPTFTANAGVVSITNTAVGTNNYTVEIDGERSNPVAVEVRGLEYKTGGSWNGVALNGLKVAITGKSSDKPDDIGMARILGMGMNDAAALPPVFKDKAGSPAKYGAKLGEEMGIHADYLEHFKPFAVRSFAFSQKSGRVYAAMTGGVAYSDSNGSSWELLDPLPLYDNSGKYKGAEESHPGCLGTTRRGTRNVGGEDAVNPLVNFVEVCDILVVPNTDGTEGLIIATDFGPFVYPNVDARAKDASDKQNAMKGGTTENVLFGKVINELATAKSGDQTLIVAATSDGVYVNAKNGDPTAWQQVDKAGLKDAVNTVAVSGSTIYAGTDKGLFKSNGLDAGSTFTQVSISKDVVATAPKDPYTKAPTAGLAVKSVAVDAADPATLYIGTDKGLKVSRDCAGSVTDVASDVGEVRSIATAADKGRSAIALTSKNGLYTSVGAAGTPGTCAALLPANVAEKPKPNGSPTTTGQAQPPNGSTGPTTVAPK